MKQNRLYLIGILLSILSLTLFVAGFVVFLTTSHNLIGLESYIYWLIYQSLLVVICTYQYIVAIYHVKTSIKMSLLFIVPLIALSLFTMMDLGYIQMHLAILIAYLSIFTLNGLLYLLAAHLRRKTLNT